MKWWLSLLCCLPALPCLGNRIQIACSIAPQAAVVRAVCGGAAEPVVLLPAGASPENYSPTVRQLALCGKCGFYWSIGVPMERGFLPKLQAAFPDMNVLAFSPSVTQCLDGSREMDPHVWLSLANLAEFAHQLAQALGERFPERKAQFAEGADCFAARLREQRRNWSAQLQGHAGETVMVYHPAYGYFLSELGLKQLSVEQEGKTVGMRRLTELAEVARKLSCRLLLAPPQCSSRSVKAAADMLKLQPKTVDPLAENLLENLEKLAVELSSEMTGKGR